jgi:glycosyltransferase involved in cell wall biosynthesis
MAEVSAIITAMTDNEQHFLKSSILAAQSDPYVAQIIVCVTSGNTWIDEILNQLPPHKLEVHRLPMMNLSRVRNYGIRKSRCEWVAFCDGDDVWCDRKTELQLRMAYQKQAAFVGADHWLVDADGHTRASGIARYIPMPSSWLVRRDVMLRYPFDEDVYQGQDGEWWARTKNSVKKYRFPLQLIKYRVRAQSLSRSHPSKKRKAWAVKLGENPVMGKFVLMGTYCVWFLFRRKTYRWHRNWVIET